MGRRGRRRTDSWGVFPAVTAPPQPRSSLPLRAAPAFCFTRGTTNAAAAMLTPEPGGGARRRRAQCGCASPADGAPGGPGSAAPSLSREREAPAGPRRPSALSAPRPPGRRALPRGPAAPGSRSLCRGQTRAPPGKCGVNSSSWGPSQLSAQIATPPPSPRSTPLSGARRVSLPTKARDFRAGRAPYRHSPSGGGDGPGGRGRLQPRTLGARDLSRQRKHFGIYFSARRGR